ncbi:hypothetical protein M514_15969 [Trichuris suis]|uniref:Uncharacterized protein n=1 Tax=Trichuris suis TaxID=68888 RepID=A0A085NQW3_9BILA|nr:hypothetical protein M514_15969 [Trichuris suis]
MQLACEDLGLQILSNDGIIESVLNVGDEVDEKDELVDCCTFERQLSSAFCCKSNQENCSNFQPFIAGEARTQCEASGAS